MELLKQIPSSEEVIAKYPLTAQCAKIKLERDKEIRRVFENKSNQLLLIIGPCSADNEKAVLEYVLRLAKIHEKVQDRILIIPRIYTSKPRTNGNGYKGLLHQPFIGSGEDMAVGIFAVRRIHIKVIEETGLFSADEMLYPEVLHYIYDLLSYVTIGARSVENQQHRLTASGLDVPVGMKNPISGNIKTMLNAVSTAQHSHHFIHQGWEAISRGNKYAHAVLRGYINAEGNSAANYRYDDLINLYSLYCAKNLENMSVIIDCNHGNSNKDYLKQGNIALDILTIKNKNDKLDTMIKGLMIESYLEDGCQSVYNAVYGKSITDPCLGWEKTEKLILQLADRLAG